MEFECRLELRLEIVHAAHRHFRFLHQLQQRRLHPTSAHVATNQISRGRNLIDLVDINDPELRQVHVAIGLVHQLAHQIFNVTTDIAGLAELGRVRFHKRHFDQVRDVLDQICFADTGWADQDHILLNIFDLLRPLDIFFLEAAQIVGVVVMIANGNRENLLRLILLYHEPIKMRFNIARQEVEFEFLMVCLLDLFLVFCRRLLRLRKGRNRDPITEVLFHELRDLGFQLFR